MVTTMMMVMVVVVMLTMVVAATAVMAIAMEWRQRYNGGKQLSLPSSSSAAICPLDASSPFFAKSLELPKKKLRQAFQSKVEQQYAKDRSVIPRKVAYPVPATPLSTTLQRRLRRSLQDVKDKVLHASALSVLPEFRALTAEGAASHTFAMLKLSWDAGTQNQMQPAGRAWMLCALPVGHPVSLDAHISLRGCEGLELMFVRDDFIKSSVLLTELHCQQPLVEASSEVGALNYLDSVKLGALVARTDIDQIHQVQTYGTLSSARR